MDRSREEKERSEEQTDKGAENQGANLAQLR